MGTTRRASMRMSLKYKIIDFFLNFSHFGIGSEFEDFGNNFSERNISRSLDNRRATAIRREWVDGVTLKVFEIKDYWKWIRAEAEKTAKRKLEATRKAQKAKEDEERRRIQQQQQRSVARIPVPMHSLIPSERNNVPYLGSQQQRRPNGNERGFLEKVRPKYAEIRKNTVKNVL